MQVNFLKQKDARFFASIIFIAVELVFFIIIHSSNGALCHASSFLSILTAFLFALIFAKKNFVGTITIIALFFTSVSDLLLCGFFDLTINLQTLSVISFLIVQICYFIRIYKTQKSSTLKLVHLSVRLSATILAIIVTVFVLKDNLNALAIISVAYYLNLILNAVFAGINVKNEPLLFVGLVLFALCDFFVGINFLENYISLDNASFINFLLSIPFNMAWLFYLPAQTILSLQIVNKKHAKKRFHRDFLVE